MNSSVLTNSGAMTALQTLRNINSDLTRTQDMISTGKKVGSAYDSAALWTISKVMESDLTAFESLSNNLGLAQATVGVAKAASEEALGVMENVYDKIVTATTTGVDYTAIQTEVDELMAQVGDIMNAAQFNGVNLVTGTAGTDDLVLTNRINRSAAGAVTTSQLTVAAENLDGTVTTTAGAVDVGDAATARTTLATFEGWLDSAQAAAAAFGTYQQRLDSQSSFLSQMTDSIKQGIGAVVDADLEKASARLQALQVQQQLGVQALSIANQAPQTILSLFR